MEDRSGEGGGVTSDEAQSLTNHPNGELVIQSLTPEYFDGAREMRNVFIGERKAACLCLKYKWCPTSAKEFNAPYLRDPDDRMLATGIAVKDGRVVGLIQVSTKTPKGDTYRTDDEKQLHTLKLNEAYVEMAAVCPSARGQGVGTKLLQWAEDLALERGCNVLSLGVVAGNPAKRLYLRFGFVDKQEDCCELCISNICVTMWLGCPHWQCGGSHMEKKIDPTVKVGAVTN